MQLKTRCIESRQTRCSHLLVLYSRVNICKLSWNLSKHMCSAKAISDFSYNYKYYLCWGATRMQQQFQTFAYSWEVHRKPQNVCKASSKLKQESWDLCKHVCSVRAISDFSYNSKYFLCWRPHKCNTSSKLSYTPEKYTDNQKRFAKPPRS